MPLLFNSADAITYLQQFMVGNKARGMIAEIALDNEFKGSESRVANKILAGGWLFSPNVAASYQYRYAAFVIPHVFVNLDELNQYVIQQQNDRGWQALATFLFQAGFDVIVSGAINISTETKTASPHALKWYNFKYADEQLRLYDDNEPFSKWHGGRGRASNGADWSDDVVARFNAATQEQLTTLTLRQAFYYGYLKQTLKIPFNDPYDVDAFIVGYRGSVMPVEVKEKSPTVKGHFGIDAGRILMLLRLGLVTDSNALYLIREVDTSATRNFVGWKYITLADIIMGCNWNLQAGGAGMGGGATQTVMIDGSLFQDFEKQNLSEEWLEKHHSLNHSVKETAQQITQNLLHYF